MHRSLRPRRAGPAWAHGQPPSAPQPAVLRPPPGSDPRTAAGGDGWVLHGRPCPRSTYQCLLGTQNLAEWMEGYLSLSLMSTVQALAEATGR